MTAVLGDIQRMESARRHRQQDIDRLKTDVKECGYAASRAEESAGVKSKTAAAIRVTIVDLEAQAAAKADAVLIDRSVVEHLNEVIQGHGAGKVETLVAIKDFKKGIYDLQWEKERLDRYMSLRD